MSARTSATVKPRNSPSISFPLLRLYFPGRGCRVTFYTFCLKLKKLCDRLSVELEFNEVNLPKIKKLYVELFDCYLRCKQNHSKTPGVDACCKCYVIGLIHQLEFFRGLLIVKDQHTVIFAKFFLDTYLLFSPLSYFKYSKKCVRFHNLRGRYKFF